MPAVKCVSFMASHFKNKTVQLTFLKKKESCWHKSGVSKGLASGLNFIIQSRLGNIPNHPLKLHTVNKETCHLKIKIENSFYDFEIVYVGWDRMGSRGMGEGVGRKVRPQAVAHL